MKKVFERENGGKEKAVEMNVGEKRSILKCVIRKIGYKENV